MFFQPDFFVIFFEFFRKSTVRPLLKMQVDDHFSKGNKNLNGDGKEEKEGVAEADKKEIEKLIQTVKDTKEWKSALESTVLIPGTRLLSYQKNLFLEWLIH